MALLADAAHALSDLIADLITLGALRLSRKPPNEQFPWGYGKIETLGTLGVGGLLLAGSVGIGWKSYELIVQLIEQGEIEASTMSPVAIWIAVGSVGIKEALFRYTLDIGNKMRSSVLIANAWHHRSDAWSSIVAILGVGGAVLGMPALDPIAGIIVSGMILQQGVGMTVSSMKELIDANVDWELARDIEETTERMIQDKEGIGKHVLELSQVRGRKMGHYTLVDMYLTVHPRLSVSAAHLIVEHVRHEILSKFPMVTELLVHILPEGNLNEGKTLKSLMRPQAEIEQDIHELLSKMKNIFGVSHITVHYVAGKCLVQAEILVDLDQTVRSASEIAKEANAILKTIEGVDEADVHLEISDHSKEDNITGI
jgi:cation diffusion facilitator family transporter